MAVYAMRFTSDGKVFKELTYRNQQFSYAMIPDESGSTSDDVGFDDQVLRVFPEESEDALEVLHQISFASEDEISDYVLTLTLHERNA